MPSFNIIVLPSSHLVAKIFTNTKDDRLVAFKNDGPAILHFVQEQLEMATVENTGDYLSPNGTRMAV
jgi:hypothetical protein